MQVITQTTLQDLQKLAPIFERIGVNIRGEALGQTDVTVPFFGEVTISYLVPGRHVLVFRTGRAGNHLVEFIADPFESFRELRTECLVKLRDKAIVVLGELNEAIADYT